MQLRNAVLIALAFDATPDEINHAHDIIDRVYSDGNSGGVSPEYIVSANVPSAPGGTSTPAATNIAGVELDSTGLPWHPDIHSSNKKKTNDGKWWDKRGVDATTRAKVEAALRASIGATPPASNVGAPAPSANVPMPGANVAPSLLPAPSAGPALPAPGAAVPDPAYAALVQLIAANTQGPANPAGRLNDAWVKQVLEFHNVPDGSLQNLAFAPQLVPAVHAYITSALAQ